MVRARLFSIDSAFEKTSFFGSILFLVFDLILVSFSKKVPLRTENSRKKGIRRRGGGDTHLREKDIQQVAAQELAASKMSSAALRRKNKNRRAIWRGRWLAAGANESTEQKIQSGLYLSRVSLCAPSQRIDDGGTCFYTRDLFDGSRESHQCATEGWDQGTFLIFTSL